MQKTTWRNLKISLPSLLSLKWMHGFTTISRGHYVHLFCCISVSWGWRPVIWSPSLMGLSLPWGQGAGVCCLYTRQSGILDGLRWLYAVQPIILEKCDNRWSAITYLLLGTNSEGGGPHLWFFGPTLLKWDAVLSKVMPSLTYDVHLSQIMPQSNGTLH